MRGYMRMSFGVAKFREAYEEVKSNTWFDSQQVLEVDSAQYLDPIILGGHNQQKTLEAYTAWHPPAYVSAAGSEFGVCE
jgi:hypothetical protein